jgi:hypothetical protein
MARTNDRNKRVLLTEQECGKRAAFHVLYRRGSKQYVDPVFPAQARTADEAGQFILATARALRWKIQIMEAYPVDQDVAMYG